MALIGDWQVNHNGSWSNIQEAWVNENGTWKRFIRIAPIDGGYTAWSSYGACTVDCGGGTQGRTRTCTNPAPQYGGAACVGAASESQACNTQACSTPVSVSFTQCFDHYAGLYYDGNGNIYISSHEPSGSIHTGRGDCGGAQQGNYLRYSFNKSAFSTLNVTVSVSGRNGSGSQTINQSVNSTWGRSQVGPTDGSGGAAGYSFTIVGTLT